MAVVAVVAASGCEDGREAGPHMVADNRTDIPLTIYGISEIQGSIGEFYIGTAPPSTRQALDSAGCTNRGLEARDDDGKVVAALDPVDPDEVGCEFTWVITPDDHWIEQ